VIRIDAGFDLGGADSALAVSKSMGNASVDSRSCSSSVLRHRVLLERVQSLGW
jgi:hypothetical protein